MRSVRSTSAACRTDEVCTSYLDPGRWLLWIGETDFREAIKQWRSFLERDFGIDLGEVRVVGALREMSEHDVFRAAVEAASDPIGEIFVREMAQARKDALLQFPRVVVAGLEHVSTVIRFDHDGRAAAESFRDQRGDVTEIHYRRDLHALVSGGETEVVDGVVWNCERMKIDFTD